MGLFYTSFNTAVINAYTASPNLYNNFESFLDSKEIKKLYKEYQVDEGSLHWALNINEIFTTLKEKPAKYEEKIRKPLDSNFADWVNDDHSYLIPKKDKK